MLLKPDIDAVTVKSLQNFMAVIQYQWTWRSFI